MAKKYIITNAKEATEVGDENPRFAKYEIEGPEEMQVSDGYHTMDELYEHRIVLFIALCKQIEEVDENTIGPNRVWRSKLHSDGSEYEGWFIMGINIEKGSQISYHLPMRVWNITNFADTLDKAPEWDKHSSTDVLYRLINNI